MQALTWFDIGISVCAVENRQLHQLHLFQVVFTFSLPTHTPPIEMAPKIYLFTYTNCHGFVFSRKPIEETVYQRLSIQRLLKYPFYFCVVLKSSVKLCKAPICVALVLGFRTARVVMCTQARVSHLLTNRVRAASTLSKQTSQNEHAEHKG